MDKRKATLAALVLATALNTTPAYACTTVSDCLSSLWPWKKVERVIPAPVTASPALTKAQKECLEECLESKTAVKKKEPVKETGVRKRTSVPARPNGNPDLIHNHKDPIGNFCETKDGLYDQVKFFKPQLGPWQRTHGYSLRTEGPEFFDDLIVTGDEVRSRGKRYMTDDGRVQYVLPLDYTEILSRNGREVTRESHNYKLIAYDCPGTTNVTFNQTINTCGTCDEGPAKKTGTTKTETKRGKETETKHDKRKDVVLDEPTPFGDWKSRKEWTVGIGTGTDTTESAVIIKTTGKPDRIVPYEDIFTITKTHAKFDYMTNNDLFSVHGAAVTGTDTPGDGYWAGCERYVDGKSVGGLAEIGLFNTKVTPYVVGGTEWKDIGTGTSAGRFGNTVDTKYQTFTPHAGFGMLGGRQNYNHVKAAVEYVWQEMNMQNYGLSPNNEGRGDAATEGMIMVTAAGQKFAAGDKVRMYFDAKAMQPKSIDATNEAEVIQDSKAYNGRIGFDYYFTPTSSGSWKLGVEGQVAVERAKFPRGIDMNRTSTAGMVNFGYTWK